MAKIKVLAGDFGKQDMRFGMGVITLALKPGQWLPDTIPISELESVETASEESVKRVGGAVGWGVAGAALLGPVGLLAGVLAGGRGKEVTFVARLMDGRKFLATTDGGTYNKLLAATFK